MKWAYGITTVPDRQFDYLPETLESLAAAGFDEPVLFVDGGTIQNHWKNNFQVVERTQQIRAYGNWILSLMELWIRNPHADRFAIFQDDLVTYSNLRTYLQTRELPDDRYWNLYTFPQNEDLDHREKNNFYMSNQRGRGAVALVFPNELVFKLLSNPVMIAKPKATKNPHKNIDGTISVGLNMVKGVEVLELVHYPTLVQHTGSVSSLGNPKHDLPTSFLGKEYDAMLMCAGLGDVIANTLEMLNITPERLSNWLGRSCGCEERKDRLNALTSWAFQARKIKRAKALEHLEKIIDG